MTNKKVIVDTFHKVKSLGYVKSRRRNSTGVGKTFEDYIGVVENNIAGPDFAGYEIKSHRTLTQSYITLFTKSPSSPQGANSYLKNKYGTPYENNPELKKIHTSIFANKPNSYMNKYSFRLINDIITKRIVIEIRSLITNRVLDNSCYYTYHDIDFALQNKLKKLFVVSADTTKNAQGRELFHFSKAEIFENPSLNNFLVLLDHGLIMYDIRIGAYQSGTKKGKTHDHGSGFRIREKDLPNLYSTHDIIY